MTRTLLASTSPALEDRIVEACAGNVFPLRFDRLPDDDSAVLQRLGGAPLPDVLVLDGGADSGRALALAARFAERHPQISVVLVAENGPALALDALRAGIRDIIEPDADVADIRAALAHAAASAHRGTAAVTEVQAPTAPTGRVISVVSPKGGVGKTTVATNLAVGLAGTAPDSTVLVDLDIQFGDVASSLDLDPEYCLTDAVSGQAKQDAMVLKTFLVRHSTGLYVICGPDNPSEADAISGADVAQLLRTLAREFRYVVVDTAPGLGEHSLSALDQTTDLVLLTSMEVPGVRGLRKELDALAELRLLPESRHVVINFADPHGLLSVADVEAVIGTKVDLQLPRSAKVAATAVNQGVPLLQSGGRNPLTKSLRVLVRRLVGEDVPVVRVKEPKDRSIKPRHAVSRWRRPRMVA